MLLVVGGVGLLIVAAVSAVIGVRDWPLWNALRRVRPTTPERLAKAARDGRIFRIEEHDIIYYGPRTGQNVELIRTLIHQRGTAE